MPREQQIDSGAHPQLGVQQRLKHHDGHHPTLNPTLPRRSRRVVGV